MCEFADPWLLLLLPAVPLLVWWWLRRPRAALRFSDTGSLAGLPAGRSRWVRGTIAAFRGLGLLLLVLALAGPRWPDVHSRISTEGLAIQMVVDVSGSMAEPDFDWDGKPISRLEAIKRAFHLLVEGGEGPDGQSLEGRPDDLIGLVTFATWPDTACPLTLSHSVLLRLLDKAQPRTVPTENRTNIGDALAWALHRLEAAPTARQVVILLSDGEHNIPPPALTPRQAAQLAANRHVPVYTIDAGGDTNVDEGTTDGEAARTAAEIREAGAKALRVVAQITKGRYFRARDTAGLLAVCREIDRLERREIQSFVYQRYYEGYPWVGLAALGCWLMVYVLEMIVWRVLP